MPVRRRVRLKPRQRPGLLRLLLMLVLVVGILYAAKSVIVPLALSILLTFILTPLVVSLQRRGLKRIPAVLAVVLLTLVLCGAIGWGVATQVDKLSRELPAHTGEMKQKIAKIRGDGSGLLARLWKTAQDVQAGPDQSRPAATPGKPVVIAQPPEPSEFSQISALIVASIEPIASTGVVLILVIFMLINREDLRNRVIGLLGHGRLTGTTRVLVHSAQRLSRLLLAQLAVNCGFGLLFGVGLAIVGVPYWFLWGFLAALLRFVPYIGSWMAAAFPLLLSFAVTPGFTQPLLVLAVFLVLDLTTANVVEPLLFGHSAGVSPVALLVAAVFWTWVWGPIGLILSTPLTVCLVVLGQHVPRLKFLSLLLSDRPALAPHVSFYQRLLAGDVVEADLVANDHAAAKSAHDVPDDVLIPALQLARRDRRDAGLAADDESFIFESTRSVLERLNASPAPGSEAAVRSIVFGCPAHHESEELVLGMLAMVAAPLGAQVEIISTRALPADIEARIERERPTMAFIAIVPPGGIAQARYLCRRLRRRFPDLPIIVGYFGRVRDFDSLLVRLRAAGASYLTTSILQSRTQIVALLSSGSTTVSDALPLNPQVVTT